MQKRIKANALNFIFPNSYFLIGSAFITLPTTVALPQSPPCVGFERWLLAAIGGSALFCGFI
jgi:hypothetical protein